MPPKRQHSLEAAQWRVYVITHMTTGHEYFGQTCESLDVRWRGHIAGAKRNPATRFLKAVAEHGASAFTGKTLIEGLSQAEASDFETMLILSKDPDRVYNEYESGGAALRADERAATGQRISQSPAWLAHRERMRAQWADPEQRAAWLAKRKPRGFNQGSSDWWRRMSPEERTAQMQRRWDTRRAKKAQGS